MNTTYGIFIVESLRMNDPYRDGEELNNLVELMNIPAQYEEALSKQHFTEIIDKFLKSNFRYLHLSCHADMEGIEINGENISNSELAVIFNNRMKGKRLFLSACEGGNRHLATAFITKGKGQSIIGTPIGLDFDKAALFWPAFYHVINLMDSTKMNKVNLKEVLRKCVDLFRIPINYYSGISNERKFLRRYKFRFNENTINNKISIGHLR